MALDFNTAPYYDDFDPAKNFYRILFKPGYAVQARELTQSQSIAQNQIVQFASSIFAQNTPISGGKVTTNLNCYYIKLLATAPSGVTSDSIVSQFLGQTIQDQTGTIVATVIAAIPSTGVGGDPTTLIVSYLSGQQFPDGAILYNTLSNLQLQAIGSDASGSSSVASVSQGTFWVSSNYTNTNGEIIQNGAFVQVNPQTIVLDKYDNVPSLRVGLNITENIINSNLDTSLLDPAIGASNFQAPGADRYQILLTLITVPLTLGSNDQGFIELTRIVNGNIVYVNNTTQYSSLDDYFAKRTYEINGDFIVNNFGLNPVSNTSTPNGHNGYTQYDLKIGKGLAYVHGYRIENQSTLVLTNDRAQTTVKQNDNYNYIDYGQYFYVDTLSGLFDVSTSPKVDVHIVGAGSIISTNANTYNSTLVGSGYMTDLVFNNNSTDANTLSYVFKAYVNNIVTKSLTGNAVSATATTITFPNNGLFSTIANAYYGVTLTITGGPSAGDSRTIVSYNASTLTANVSVPFTTVPTANSLFALQFGPQNIDSIVIANTTYAISANANINIQGKLGNDANNNTFYQNPDVPELVYDLGFPYVASVSGTSYTSRQVFRRKQFTGSPAALQIVLPAGAQGVVSFSGGPGTLSADAIKQNYIAVITNTTNAANTGASNTILNLADTANLSVVVSGTNNSTLTLTDRTGKYTGATLTVSIIAKVNILNADNTQRILKTKTLITGNTTSNVAVSGTAVTGVTNVFYDLTNAQVYIRNSALVGVSNTQYLYVTDVKNIVKIVDSLSPGTPVTAAMMSNPANDITNSFALDNGQRDSIYNHAAVTLLPGALAPKGNILIVFNYYSHTAQSADGYFSYQSYVNENYAEIPFYVSKRGTVYPLRDCVDFRPCRVNGTSVYSLEYTGNPSSDDTGTYIPEDLSNFISDYSYYLGRSDRLVLSKDKNFQIIQGNPSLNPQLPAEPDGSLVIANLYHDPYTAYLPAEVPRGILANMSVEPVKHRRWTMEDITGLESRLDSYTNSLNPGEQTASNYLIADKNGIPRVKNAIIVDDFTSFGIADTSNPYFLASIDTLKNRFSTPHFVYNFALQANTSVQSLNQLNANTANTLGFTTHNLSKVSRYYSLPYSSKSIVTQPLASRSENLNPFAIQVYQGVGSLYPPMDNWIDGSIAPDLLLANIDNLVQSPAAASSTITKNINSMAQWGYAGDNGITGGRPGQMYNVEALSTAGVALGLSTINVNNWQSIPGVQVVTAGSAQIPVNLYYNSQGVLLGSVSETKVQYTGNANDAVSANTISAAQAALSNPSTFNQSSTPSGASSSLVSSYALNNTYAKNNTIQPYIRAQQLIFRAKNMQVNTPISCWFDNVNVNKYMTNPNVIELKNSKGTWKEDDVIGISSNNVFYPIGVVAFTYNYPNTSNVRLYITSDFQTNYNSLNNSDYITDIISNGNFDANGNYVSNTAYGQILNTQVITQFNNGYLSGVGGSFTDTTANTISGIYTMSQAAYGVFATSYGIWNTPNPSAGGKFDVTFPLSIFSNTTYYIAGQGDDEIKVYVDGTLRLTGTYSDIFTSTALSLTTGNHTVRIVNNAGDADAFVACAISTAAWTASKTTTGTVIWSTRSPYNTTLPNNITGIATVSAIPGGGNYYTGVTNVILNPLTSNLVSLNAHTINIITPVFNVTGTKTGTATYSSNITSYNANTRVATISPAVSVTIGQNQTYGLVDSTYSVTGTANNYVISQTVGGASPLSTNENGTFCGIFNVPSGTFTTGNKIFRVDNRKTSNDPGSATTYAESTFYGSSLANQQNGNYNFSPSVVASSQVVISTATAPTASVAQNPTTTLLDPLAQTFSIDPKVYPKGVFLYSMNFFFKTKAVVTQSPVTLMLVGTSNGNPSGQTLDNSIVVLNPDRINISNTPNTVNTSTSTEFVFPSPVYIQPGVSYAAILKSPSTEYNVWIAAQNDIALQSNTKITSAPYTGQLFETQNSISWTGDTTKSIMFILNRCVFDITKHPKIPFVVTRNVPQQKTATKDILGYYTGGQATNQEYEINALNVTTTDYTPANTSITYSYQAALQSTRQLSTETSIIPGRYGAPNFDNEFLGDNQGPRLLSANNANSFVLYATMNSTDDRMTPIIADDGLTLYTVMHLINNLPLYNTNINLLYGGAGYNANTTYVSISSPDVSGGTQATANAVVTSGAVTSLYITNPGSGYLKLPTISVLDANVGAPGTGALVTTTTEFSPIGGNASARYMSKVVTLSNTNNCGDLRVYLTAYRPVGSDIFVFYRIQNSNDSQQFRNGSWQLLTYVNNSYAFSKNENDYLSLQLAPGINGYANNQVSYLSTSTGLTYSTFNQFDFKVVFASSDATNVPTVTSLSAVALPAGN